METVKVRYGLNNQVQQLSTKRTYAQAFHQSSDFACIHWQKWSMSFILRFTIHTKLAEFRYYASWCPLVLLCMMCNGACDDTTNICSYPIRLNEMCARHKICLVNSQYSLASSSSILLTLLWHLSSIRLTNCNE